MRIFLETIRWLKVVDGLIQFKMYTLWRYFSFPFYMYNCTKLSIMQYIWHFQGINSQCISLEGINHVFAKITGLSTMSSKSPTRCKNFHCVYSNTHTHKHAVNTEIGEKKIYVYPYLRIIMMSLDWLLPPQKNKKHILLCTQCALK